MNISMIACIDEQYGIGYNNKLLFKNKEGMQWFKKHTYKKPIVMGRHTYESIGKPLKNRVNIVLTTNKSYNPHPDVLVRHSIDNILHELRHERELMIIGGEQLYTTFLPLSDRLYITKVHHKFNNVDTYFPEFNEDEWKEYYFKEGVLKSKYPYSFHVYQKQRKNKLHNN